MVKTDQKIGGGAGVFCGGGQGSRRGMVRKLLAAAPESLGVPGVDVPAAEAVVVGGCEAGEDVVAACMDDREVFFVRDGRYVVDDLWQSVFSNLKVRNYEFITEALRKGRTVYLMRANAEPDVSSWESVAVIDPLGELDFRDGCAHLIMRLYRLSPRVVD
ncbi:MAG: hypothetical protein LIO63_04585 [Akkermansia sp.]|nr:hypothetical protein [Akkermansia sp.]